MHAAIVRLKDGRMLHGGFISSSDAIVPFVGTTRSSVNARFNESVAGEPHKTVCFCESKRHEEAELATERGGRGGQTYPMVVCVECGIVERKFFIDYEDAGFGFNREVHCACFPSDSLPTWWTDEETQRMLKEAE